MSVSRMWQAVFALFLSASLADSMSSPRVPSGNGVSLEVTPNQIHEGFTDQLTINCTFSHEQGSIFSTVMSLILSKTDSISDSTYSEVATITAFSNNKVNEKHTMGAHVTGLHKPDAFSFIALEWSYPSSQVEGKYMCEANGMDIEGHPLSASANSVLEEKAISVDIVLQRVKEMDIRMNVMDVKMNALDAKEKEMDTKMNAMDAKEKEMDSKLNDLRTRVDNSKAAIIYKSTSYGGKNYLLSKQILINVPEANRLCRLYGGYLVEINDRHEFDYLVNFAHSHVPGREGVIIGATNEGHGSSWTFITSGAHMSTLVWESGQPNGGSQHCLYFWTNLKQMFDDPCLKYSSNWPVRFLCEVPN
ncbi:uncharacterized protein LOC101850944 [Aplysia californica]|uniref:Uncharacterized protein LOC101850944 n=1 Tax=Aplysia californica TaxID=6500 RepID=A0ABM0JIE4_APLCA|nr:uncharacterized protein LOC101850944 [Aplysia californica]XP_035824636.1 uncharacterized protein LOC101850944 [Aplysia californica]